MNNLEIYEKVKSVPQNAIKPILGGKLKGKSDINPMWRIKKLTEVFGPCGTGWYTEKLSEDKITLSNGEIIILVEINLFVKIGDEWQKPIYGTGGSMLLQFEKGNLVSNDEGRKMAYTDAISVACKALGFAADVYWNSDRTKYDGQPENTASPRTYPKTQSNKQAQSDEKQKALIKEINRLSNECDAVSGTEQNFYYKAVLKNLDLEKKSSSDFTVGDLTAIRDKLSEFRNGLVNTFGGADDGA